ncbi:hypothetical protein KP509_18G039600 [Ceratopteris richardii]|uniref:Uncharacterized protein n=1 Tax=Ceratopteris richardii TaxID=49495 RepID=A0A8T2STH5_CERRI|nr:hypothetical protein KP509_18G039600 [Ceratopteris richardii]
MQTYLPHHLRVVIRQLRVSSHQLEIERGRSRGVPREERWCPVCQTEVESEEHFVIRCPAYLDLRAQFHVEESFQLCMTMGDQRRLGRFLTAAYERRERSIQPIHQPRVSTQQTITQFFQRVELHQRGPSIGLTLHQAAAQRARHRPRMGGYRRPPPYQEDISRIRIAYDHMMEHRWPLSAESEPRLPRLFLPYIALLCHTEIASEEHFVKRCRAYSDLRAEFHIEESLKLCMTIGDQQRLGRLLTAAYERREQLLQSMHRMSTQQTITQFFQQDELHHTSPPSRGIGLTLEKAVVQRVRHQPHRAGYGRPRLYQEDISCIRIAHDHKMEHRRTTTTWVAFLQEALRPPMMYHILHTPPPITCS